MARARSSGGTGMAAALVVVSILFFVSMILAIVFYTQVEKNRQDAETATDELATYVKSTEKNNPEIVKLKNARSSIVGQLQENQQNLQQLISGDPSADREQINPELSSLGFVEGVVLLDEIKRLRAEQVASKLRMDGLDSQLASANMTVQDLQKQTAQTKQQYQQAVSDLNAQLQGIQEQAGAYEANVDDQRQTLEGRIAQLQQNRQTQINQLNSQIEQRDEQIIVLKRKIADIQRTGISDKGSIDGPGQPDGRVVSIIEEENLVYINIGRVDHVLLGLPFEIFDARLGVVFDDEQKLRGKATVEVVNILDQSAVCRIVRIEPSMTVNKGDVIANVVYDPDVTYKFFVSGDFDIDNAGSPSLSDRRRVETMIEAWGGLLAKELTYDVDFLVLGLEPSAPRSLPRDEVDPLTIAENAAQQQRYDEYRRLVGEAKALSISILNQNRFLALAGYYRR